MAVIYSKGWGGLHLLLRAYGSAIPRTLLASILSTALAALLFYIPGIGYFQGWGHVACTASLCKKQQVVPAPPC